MTKKLPLVVALLAIVLAAASADAQTIRPRGSATAAKPATVTPPPAPASPAAVTPVPEPVTTALESLLAPEPDVRDAKIFELQTQLDNVVRENPEHSGQIARLRSELSATGTALATARKEVAERYTRSVLLMLIFFGILMFVGGGFLGLRLRRRFARPAASTVRTGGPTATATMLAIALGLGFASQAQAAPAACEIKSVSVPGGALVTEQNAVTITVGLNGCGEVKDITVGDANVVFTAVTSAVGAVTAQVEAKAGALTGPTSVKITLVDGTEVVSPDATYLLVLDMATAQVRKDVTAATTRVASSVAVIRKEVAKAANAHLTAGCATQAYLQERVKGLASSEDLRAAIETAVAPLQARIADLEKVHPAIVAGVEANGAKLAQLANMTADLAFSQAILANTQVKKTMFGGKNPLDPTVAAAAERIRQAVAALDEPRK